MRYDELKQMVVTSGTLEGVAPTAIADALAWSMSPIRLAATELDTDDVKTAAAAAYELGRLGLGRESFMAFMR